MNQEPEMASPRMSSFDLAPGLMEFYSSQAELMLAQYENVNRLLGPTTHGTPSGDLCENLLKDFLRRFLPQSLSVDKGYFYGRSQIDGKDTHCPEIDILVHDTQNYMPLYRTGDFVIVRPQSVRAMIQVKRTFTNSQVSDGLKNVIQAKQQLVDVLWIEQDRATPKWTGSMQPPRVFTGVVGFEGQVGRNLNWYQENLLQWHLDLRAYDRAKMIETSMYVLPSFLGSLTAFFLYLDGPCNFRNQRYLAFDSEHVLEETGSIQKSNKQQIIRKNVCIQAFLAKMYNVLGGEVTEMPPFAFPTDLQPFDQFDVLRFDVVLNAEEGIIELHRNDGWIAKYRRADGPTHDQFHIISDPIGNVEQTDMLRRNITPEELFVKRELKTDQILERYVKDSA